MGSISSYVVTGEIIGGVWVTHPYDKIRRGRRGLGGSKARKRKKEGG